MDSSTSHSFSDSASVLFLLALTSSPISFETISSARLVHAINTSKGHNHGRKSLRNPGIYSPGHRTMSQFGSAMQDMFHLFHYHLTICILVHTDTTIVALQTMGLNITNGSFGNG